MGFSIDNRRIRRLVNNFPGKYENRYRCCFQLDHVGQEEDPENFRLMHAMAPNVAGVIGSAIAAGIVFWGPAEPAYHYMNPPPFFGGEAKTAQAGANAMTYSFFHWGLSAWAIYAMLTIPLAHACYTKGLPLKFSSAFYYVLGEKVHGTWGNSQAD